MLHFIAMNLWLVCYLAAAFAVVSLVIAVRGRRWGYTAFYAVAVVASIWGGWKLK